MYIIKRNGQVEPFNKDKIINAIEKAFLEVDGKNYKTDIALDIANKIYDLANQHEDGSFEVEEIQDLIEDFLMMSNRRDVAR